jgi:hypothetical protein
MKDLFGKAILDFQTNNSPENLITETNISEADEMSVDYLFRSFNEMPKSKRKHYNLSKEKFSMWVAVPEVIVCICRKKDLKVTAIDISANAIKACEFVV